MYLALVCSYKRYSTSDSLLETMYDAMMRVLTALVSHLFRCKFECASFSHSA